MQHSPCGRTYEPEMPTASPVTVCPQKLHTFKPTLSYYDKYTANRFYWQERFASSKSRPSFSSRESKRENSSPPDLALGIARFWWDEHFFSNDYQHPKRRTCKTVA